MTKEYTQAVIERLGQLPRRIVGLVFLGLAIVFFAFYLRGIDWQLLTKFHIDWRYLLLATAFALIFRYLGVTIWRLILGDLGARDLPDFVTMAYVYAKAWMGRYIPGTLTWIAGKVYLASSHGISKSRLAVSSLLEGAMQIIAILVMSMLLLGLDPRLSVIPIRYKIIMVCFAALLVITLTPRVFNRLVALAYYLVKKQAPSRELLINGRAVIRSFVLYTIGGFILGLAEFCICRTVDPNLPWHNFWFIVGTFNLAGALGMIAIGVPSGIGIRDGAVLLLLSIIMPKELALAIAVTSRLWIACADVAFLGLATAHHRLTLHSSLANRR